MKERERDGTTPRGVYNLYTLLSLFGVGQGGKAFLIYKLEAMNQFSSVQFFGNLECTIIYIYILRAIAIQFST